MASKADLETAVTRLETSVNDAIGRIGDGTIDDAVVGRINTASDTIDTFGAGNGAGPATPAGAKE